MLKLTILKVPPFVKHDKHFLTLQYLSLAGASTDEMGGALTLPLGVLIAIIIGIALIIGVLILTIGLVCLKR